MRLTDLEPRWWALPGRDGMGVTFLCPHCRTCRLSVEFRNPLDGGTPDPNTPDTLLWERAGCSFQTLSLAPSIDAKGHWHGFVRAGEIR